MSKYFTAATLLILFLHFTFSPSVLSQDKGIADAEKYKARVAKRGTGGKPIVVKLKDKTKLKGTINGINDDSFVLKESKSSAQTTIYYNQVKDIDKAFSKAETTIAIVGAGFGFTVIIVCFVARKCQD